MTRNHFPHCELATLRDLDRTSDEVRRFLAWLEASHGEGPVTPEYRPPVDVIETEQTIEILADLPGVAADALRVVFTAGAVIVAGRKGTPRCDHRGAAFHLAERTFGRFACVVQLGVAVDAGRATATLRAGELHVRLPRIQDRRGRDIEIAIESA